MLPHMKRTTLILDEAVWEGIRQVAHERRTEMSKLVNEWLREGLRRERAKRPVLSELPRHDLGDPGINLADRDVLESVMEDG
jgi:hypothetical protein